MNRFVVGGASATATALAATVVLGASPALADDAFGGSGTITDAGIIAEARAQAEELTLGDGGTLECPDFGTPWSPGATSECTHAYDVAGEKEVTATIRWAGSYTINGGAPIPIETGVARTATLGVTVNEAQAVDTSG